MEEKRKFVMVTADFSGLGFCLQEKRKNGSEIVIAFKPKEDKKDDDKDEEEPIEKKENFLFIDDIMPLEKCMKRREEYKDWYWIFDGNHNFGAGEILHEEDFKVFGGTEFQYKLENDREFGLEFAESVGLYSPPYHEFKSAEEGITFLEANEDKAYVVKPNGEDSALTQPFKKTQEPKNANLEARTYLKAMNIHDYILQERKDGVEVNVEIFFVDGYPCLAWANLETKPRHNGDLGYMTGCAMDVGWVVPLDCPLVNMTAGKLIPKMAEIGYTGFGDVNCIISDDLDVWFLEYCFRLGYNAHPNFFTTLSKKTCFQTLADMIDGIPPEMPKKGFGASVAMFSDSTHRGIPIYVPDRLMDNIHLFDMYQDKDDAENEFSMGGDGAEICIVTNHDYTIETAFEDAIKSAWDIKFVSSDFRTDGAKSDFPSSLVRRYDALKSMDII